MLINEGFFKDDWEKNGKILPKQIMYEDLLHEIVDAAREILKQGHRDWDLYWTDEVTMDIPENVGRKFVEVATERDKDELILAIMSGSMRDGEFFPAVCRIAQKYAKDTEYEDALSKIVNSEPLS